MTLLGWIALGVGIFLVDSAVHNESPVTRLKLVLGQGSVKPSGETPIDASKPVVAQAAQETGPVQ